MELIRIVRRDISSQFAHARNLKEGKRQKLVRAVWAIVYLGKALRCGAAAMRHEQLGSQVVFDGRICWISNWANSECPTLAGANGFYQKAVPRSEITNVLNVRELCHRFTFGLSFYTGNHYVSDTNRRVYSRIFTAEARP